MIRGPFFLISLFFSTIVLSQNVSWNFVNDSLTLNPNRITLGGTFEYKAGGTTKKQLSGELTIVLDQELVFLNDSNNLYRFKFADIGNLFLNNNQGKLEDFPFDMSDKTVGDKIKKFYRINIYHDLPLNELQILFSKKNKYEVIDDGVKVKNPFYLKGKICAIDFYSLLLITEEGEVHKLIDGDFINLIFGKFKFLECRGLYQIVFETYKNEMLAYQKQYEDNLKENQKIENLFKLIGPFEKVMLLPNGNRMYVWDKSQISQIVDINSNTTNSSRVISRGYNLASTSFNRNFNNLYSSSKDILTFSVANSFGSAYTSSSSFGSISGVVKSVNEGILLSLVVNPEGKIIDIYHERLINIPSYGTEFKFVNF